VLSVIRELFIIYMLVQVVLVLYIQAQEKKEIMEETPGWKFQSVFAQGVLVDWE